MDKNLAIPNVKGSSSRNKSKLTTPNVVVSNDIARALEHVSSPFRWELLEIPPVQPLSAEISHVKPKNSRLR